MATEMRRRGAPVWEIAGFLGHSCGYRTTERSAKIGPDHLAGCVRAIAAQIAPAAYAEKIKGLAVAGQALV